MGALVLLSCARPRPLNESDRILRITNIFIAGCIALAAAFDKQLNSAHPSEPSSLRCWSFLPLPYCHFIHRRASSGKHESLSRKRCCCPRSHFSAGGVQRRNRQDKNGAALQRGARDCGVCNGPPAFALP